MTEPTWHAREVGEGHGCNNDEEMPACAQILCEWHVSGALCSVTHDATSPLQLSNNCHHAELRDAFAVRGPRTCLHR